MKIQKCELCGKTKAIRGTLVNNLNGKRLEVCGKCMKNLRE